MQFTTHENRTLAARHTPNPPSIPAQRGTKVTRHICVLTICVVSIFRSAFRRVHGPACHLHCSGSHSRQTNLWTHICFTYGNASATRDRTADQRRPITTSACITSRVYAVHDRPNRERGNGLSRPHTVAPSYAAAGRYLRRPPPPAISSIWFDQRRGA